MKILILGANGMFASELIKALKDSPINIYGTTRALASSLSNEQKNFSLIRNVNFNNLDSVLHCIEEINPDFVLNLVGITKYKEKISSYADFIEVNSLAPHKIAQFCDLRSSKFIQLSTDCVFSGLKGNYLDMDSPDPVDLYGKTKALGEINTNDSSLTIRTSFIGHNENSKDGLLEWFLSQSNSCKGFNRAVYSGLTTIELASIFKNYIFKLDNLSGIYNISAASITKYDLLKLISKVYKKDIEIVQSDEWVIDRSLNSDSFQSISGYNPPTWEEMVTKMYNSRLKNV